MPECLTPPATLLVKLGSLAVHVEEGMSENGHAFDAAAVRGILADPEVRAWLDAMDGMALLPVKR